MSAVWSQPGPRSSRSMRFSRSSSWYTVPSWMRRTTSSSAPSLVWRRMTMSARSSWPGSVPSIIGAVLRSYGDAGVANVVHDLAAEHPAHVQHPADVEVAAGQTDAGRGGLVDAVGQRYAALRQRGRGPVVQVDHRAHGQVKQPPGLHGGFDDVGSIPAHGFGADAHHTVAVILGQSVGVSDTGSSQ